MPIASSPQSSDAEWQALVGKAIVCFGDIELISIKCLAHIPQDKISDSAARLEFSRRADLLIELLEGRPNLDSDMKGLLEGFKRARVLAKIRNLIAHNPIMLDLYVKLGSTDVLAEHSITSARSESQTLNLEELKEFADEVENLASELWGHFLRAAGSSDPLWRTNE